MLKIGVTSKSFCKNQKLVDELAKYVEIKLNPYTKLMTKEETIDFLKDCDGAIVALERIDEEILVNCKKLKIISKYGVGIDNINFDDCRKYGVSVVYESGVNKESVAEMTLAYMLMLLRNIYITSNELKNGIWNKNGGQSLYGKVIGIIGVGNVGKELIRLLKPFKCKILVNDIIEQDEYYLENGLLKATKEEIFINSDVVTIHTTLNDDTINLVNKKSLKLMKQSAILLNSARGQIVNLKHLKKVLKKGIIAGAAIDVYDCEPPKDKELLKLPNLICTPHIGGNSAESVYYMGISAIKNILYLYGIDINEANSIDYQKKHWLEIYSKEKNSEEDIEKEWTKFHSIKNIQNILEKYLLGKEFSNILEIGSYTGFWTRKILDIKNTIDTPTKLICVDIISEPFEYIKNYLSTMKNSNLDIDFYLTSGNELNGIESNSVNFIFSMDTFSRIPKDDIKSYFKEISRVLDDYGVCILHLPIETSLDCFKRKFTYLKFEDITSWCRDFGLSLEASHQISNGILIIIHKE